MKKQLFIISSVLLVLLSSCSEKEYDIPIKIPAVEDIISKIQDKQFKTFLQNEVNNSLKPYDTDAPYGILSSDEVAQIPTLHLEKIEPESLLGIEYFTRLEGLFLNKTGLSELHLYNNAILKTLEINESQIKKLDLSFNPQLQRLKCTYSPKLISLKLENSGALEALDCSNTNLSILHLNKCTALKEINVEGTPMKELDVSKNRNLTKFYGNDKLEKLYVSPDFKDKVDFTLSETTVIEVRR